MSDGGFNGRMGADASGGLTVRRGGDALAPGRSTLTGNTYRSPREGDVVTPKAGASDTGYNADAVRPVALAVEQSRR